MIHHILTYYAARLDEYLLRNHQQPEGIAEVGFIGNGAEEKPCKLIVSLLNVERETSGGIGAPMQKQTDGYMRMPPPLMMNLNLMFAAVYDEKRYVESLSVLSDTLKFIQSTPYFEWEGQTYTIEMITLSSQDINNVWTTLGGQYYPSVVCKLRRIVLDSEDVTGAGKTARQPDINM